MKNNSPKNLPPYSGGMIHDLMNEVKLIFRLLADKRVSFFLKIIPFGSLVYFISPDLVPGPIDDAFLIWLFAYLFVELCPPEIVSEHRQLLSNVVEGKWQDPPVDNPAEDIIDAEFHVQEEPADQEKNAPQQ